MSKNLSVGIDLGTTYSCVGLYKNGSVEILTNEDGLRTTPSYVSFSAEAEGEEIVVFVGDVAKNAAKNNPANTIYDVKRLIGRKFSEKVIQNDIKNYMFDVRSDPSDNPVITIRYPERTMTYTPEQISSIILSKIKSFSEAYTGSPVSNAVITVPAYFNDAQRFSTKMAGELAGLNVMRIINEPTAAALAYGLNLEGERTVLVYDLGGGTLDVSILTICDGIFEVKSTSGDTHLGGEDFNLSLRKYCLMKFFQNKISSQIIESDKNLLLSYYQVRTLYEVLSRTPNEVLSRTPNEVSSRTPNEVLSRTPNEVLSRTPNEVLSRSPKESPIQSHIELINSYYNTCHNLKLLTTLHAACEDAKKALSYKTNTSIVVEGFFQGDDLVIPITRELFEKLCANEFERCTKPVLSALSDANLTPSAITDVVLVGGSSRIPRIHQMLENIFGSKLRTNINPDEAVAYGAAIQANILSSEADILTKGTLLIDICPMSVGIEVAGGIHKVMIPKNTPLPASQIETFTTFTDMQPSVCIRVFEGEALTTDKLNLLGTFTLDNLPIRLKGEIHLVVRFEIDVDGIMNISATEKENGICKKICINKC